MRFYQAISLLGLHSVSHAFQAVPTPNHNNLSLKLRHRPSLLSTSALESIPALDSLLDDGHGHVNGYLAQAIFEWEVDHQADRELAKQNHKLFSARDGIRMVDQLASDILSSRGEGAGVDAGVSRADLIQEGMVALLDAMSNYDTYKARTSSGTTLEEYARESIHASFLHFLAHSGRPIRLPLALQKNIRAANGAAESLRRMLGKEPTLSQVAREIDIAPKRLARHRRLYRSMVSRANAFVSMDDEMEGRDPKLTGAVRGGGTWARGATAGTASEGDPPRAEEGRATFPRESFSAPLLSSPASLATADEQELMRINAQEDDWTSSMPERVRDTPDRIVADMEEANNPLPFTHHTMLNDKLTAFLMTTLTDKELTVIQLRFGLVDPRHGGKGWTFDQISMRLGLPYEEVVLLARGALEKMREAAPSNWDEDNDAFVEVSL